MSHFFNIISRFCFFLTTGIFFLSGISLSAQDRNTLEKQRLQIIEKIEETAQLLTDNKKTKTNTITDFNLLESQINFREDLIKNIEFEISQAAQLENESKAKLDSLNLEIDQLQERYVRLVRALYIKKQAQHPLANLLSIKSINDAFRRWSYTKQYETHNQRQAMKIMHSHTKASQELDQLKFYKTQREKLMGIETEHRDILEDELTAKDGILQNLSSNEKDLRSQLQKHHSNRETFNGAIEMLIIAELASGQKTELNLDLPDINEKDNSTGKSSSRSSSRKKVTKSGFSANKGKLPWPIDKGVVVQKYGKQNHPTIKNLKISNNGIDIAAAERATVNCIYDGKVIGISFIPGYDNMVMVQHGDYYTVYSKLKEVFVEKGAAVSTSQAIGRLGNITKEGNVEMHFELWKGKSKQNPERWLQKK